MSRRREVLSASIFGKPTADAFKRSLRYPGTNQLIEYAMLSTIALDRRLRPPIVAETREPVDRFVVDELRPFGDRLDSWTLSNGIRMRDAFPTVAQAATLLSGAEDPRDYFPVMRPPIKFKDDRLGSFSFLPRDDPEDPRSIELRYPGHKPIEVWWIQTDTNVTVHLNSELHNNDAGLGVLIKEVNQIIDYLKYATTYLSLARRAGVRIRFNNPSNIPTPQRVLLGHMALATVEVEYKLFGRDFLGGFFDVGSAMKTLDVLATWYQDYLKYNEIGDNPIVQRVVEEIHVNSRLLRGHGLLKEQSDKTIVNLPPVDSIAFFRLMRNFQGQMKSGYSTPIDRVLRPF